MESEGIGVRSSLRGGAAMKRWAWAVGLALLAAGGLRADEEAAVKALEKHDALLTRNTRKPGVPVVGVALVGEKNLDCALKWLQDLKHLEKLGLYYGATDESLKQLKGLDR